MCMCSFHSFSVVFYLFNVKINVSRLISWLVAFKLISYKFVIVYMTACSHGACTDFFIASIAEDTCQFLAYPCASNADADAVSCTE